MVEFIQSAREFLQSPMGPLAVMAIIGILGSLAVMYLGYKALNNASKSY